MTRQLSPEQSWAPRLGTGPRRRSSARASAGVPVVGPSSLAGRRLEAQEVLLSIADAALAAPPLRAQGVFHLAVGEPDVVAPLDPAPEAREEVLGVGPVAIEFVVAPVAHLAHELLEEVLGVHFCGQGAVSQQRGRHGCGGLLAVSPLERSLFF